MHFPLKFLQKRSPYFFHGAFAPLFIWSRRPWGGGLLPPRRGPGREPRLPAVLGILDIKSVGVRETKPSFFHDQAAVVFRWVTK